MRLLRKLTELVDKDVSANSKPISIIGMAVPFVPFMIFVDGAPADRYPVLSGLALAASICWGLFVMWRLLRHLQVEISGSQKSLGSLRFWLIIAATVLSIILLVAGKIWLSDKIGWPEAYGFSCHGRGCLLEDLANSPQLLDGGSGYEVGLFALLWLLPAGIGGVLVYALLKRLNGRNHIRPLD